MTLKLPAGPHWSNLQDRHQRPYDPRPLVEMMRVSGFKGEQWDKLEDLLCDSECFGNAAYAAVCLLVNAAEHQPSQISRIAKLAVHMELMETLTERTASPAWLQVPYERALKRLTILAIHQLTAEHDEESIRPLLALISLTNGLKYYAIALAENTNEELKEFLVSP